MKIAFVSDAIYPYNKGGKEKRIHEISTRLAKQGHDVHLYCMKWWDGSGSKTENAVHLHSICNYYPLYSEERRSIKEAIMFFLACFKLIKEKFDVVDVDHIPHLVLFPVKFVCLIKRKKLVATWNEVWGNKYWKEYLGKLGIIAFLIEWFSARMPDRIISVSEHTKAKLIKDLRLRRDICVISNGIDMAKIQAVNPSEEKSDLIFVGRLLSHKNVDVLIKSIKLIKGKYPKIKCFIVGDGPEKDKLEDLTKGLNLEKNVKFLGFLESHDDVYSLIKSSRVFILLSTREGFGIVALEANACGVPVVTVDYQDNAAKDLIREGKNGFVCRLDEKEVAKRVMAVLSGDLTMRMKKDCVTSAEKYDWNRILDQAEEVYQA